MFLSNSKIFIKLRQNGKMVATDTNAAVHSLCSRDTETRGEGIECC